MIVFAALLALTAGWEKVADKDGVLIERLARDHGLYEVRASVTTPVTPEQFMATLSKHEDYIQFVPHLKDLKVLVNDADKKVIYEQIKMPLVSDRDYTVKVTHSCDAETHLCESHFETANDLGPPPSKDYVRVGLVHGGWTMEPTEGGSVVTYHVFSDPGGAIPAWIINSAQKDATRDFVLAMVARAKKNAGIK